MKKRIQIYWLVILIIIIIVITILMVSYYLHKTAFTTQPISSFDITQSDNIRKGSLIIVSSDSILYTMGRNINDLSVSYAYSFDGKLLRGYNLPADSINKEIFDFKFLNGRNQLCLNMYYTNLDFYDAMGNPKRQEKIHPYSSMFEWQNALYFTNLDYVSGLYKEHIGRKQERVNYLPWNKEESFNSFSNFMFDSNGKNIDVVAEVKENKISIFFNSGNKLIKFHIKRKVQIEFMKGAWYLHWENWALIPYLFKDVSYKLPMLDGPIEDIELVFAGENYIVLKCLEITDKSRSEVDKIYNLHGRYLGQLICSNDNDASLVEISGDKLIFLNRITGRINIEQIKVR